MAWSAPATATIGTGGHAIVDLIARHLAPQMLGEDPERIEAIWKKLFFHTHATAVGAITLLALAAIDTALWDMKCRRSGRPLHIEAGGAQKSVPLYTTEGGWLHIEIPALVEDALRAKAAGFGGSKIKVGAARRKMRSALRLSARPSAPTSKSWSMATRAPMSTTPSAGRGSTNRLTSPGGEEPLPAEDLGGHIRLSQSTTLPVAVGESIYSISHFREYLQQGACSIVQADVARIGGITPGSRLRTSPKASTLPSARTS